MLGALNSTYPAGKVVALFLVTWVADRFGRKKAIAIGCVTCIAFAVMQGLSQSLEAFIASRALLGFCTSFLAQPSPILITELAYPTQRGKLTALYNTSFVSWFPCRSAGFLTRNSMLTKAMQYLGGIIAAWTTFGTFKMASTWSWRIPSILQGLLPAIQLLGIWFLPESPRWLVAHGNRSQAYKILADYHAGGDMESPLVAFELAEIETALTNEADCMSQNSWFDLIRTPANRKRTLIAVLVGWFAQWNGVNIISYYLTLVLGTIGITDPEDQNLINGLLQISNWLTAIFIGALLVDRLGRRTLFLASTGGMLVCYIAWTGLTSYFDASQNEDAGKAVVAFVFLTFFFYAIAWAPLLQAYIVEIFPYTLRGRGISTMYISTFVGLVTGSQVNPIAMASIGWKYYIVFCCILAALVVIIYFCFPETKGYSLEEIKAVFEGTPLDTNGKLADEEKNGAMTVEGKKGEVKQIEVL